MRHTLLKFTTPMHESPEPRITMVTKEGINMDYTKNESKL